MESNNSNSHLKSTFDILERAFPEGVGDHYIWILKALYEYLSDENLAIVMSQITGKDFFYVTNDIFKSAHLDENDPCYKCVLNRLNKHGFKSWSEDE